MMRSPTKSLTLIACCLQLLGCLLVGSCKSDPEAELLENTFSALQSSDADALGRHLGLGGSTPELKALVDRVKIRFGDITPIRVWEKRKEHVGGASLGKISLAAKPTTTSRGVGMPFKGSTGEEGVMELDFGSKGGAPISFSVVVQIEKF